MLIALSVSWHSVSFGFHGCVFIFFSKFCIRKTILAAVKQTKFNFDEFGPKIRKNLSNKLCHVDNRDNKFYGMMDIVNVLCCRYSKIQTHLV